MNISVEKKEALKIHKQHLKEFKNNKYILNVYKSMTIIYIYNRFDKISIDFKNKYFKNIKHWDILKNVLLEYLYPIEYDIPQKDIKKAIETVKKYINNFRKYA